MNNWINKVLIPVLRYAGIMAGISILHSVLMDVFGLTFSSYNSFAGLGILAIGVVIAMLAYRKEHSRNQISYGKAVGIGVLISFVFGILIAVYSVINFTYINKDFIEISMQNAEEKYIEQGTDAEMIEMIVDKQRKMMTPVNVILLSTVSMTFMGLIVSLIAAAFVKKETAYPFNDIEAEE